MNNADGKWKKQKNDRMRNVSSNQRGGTGAKADARASVSYTHLDVYKRQP